MFRSWFLEIYSFYFSLVLLSIADFTLLRNKTHHKYFDERKSFRSNSDVVTMKWITQITFLNKIPRKDLNGCISISRIIIWREVYIPFPEPSLLTAQASIDSYFRWTHFLRINETCKFYFQPKWNILQHNFVFCKLPIQRKQGNVVVYTNLYLQRNHL